MISGYSYGGNSCKPAMLKILDKNHNYSGEIIELNIQIAGDSYNFFNSAKIKDGYLYYIHLTDRQSGYSDIRRISIQGGTEENIFANVSGQWEVLSFAIGGEFLYYSSYRGTNINNGRIALATKANAPLDNTFKLSSIAEY